MYRGPELQMMAILAITSTIFLTAAFIFVAIFIFFDPVLFYRNLALIFLVLSLFARLQIFMYKQIIIEKRLLRIVEPSLQHFKVAVATKNLNMIVYFVVFWIALLGLIICFFK